MNKNVIAIITAMEEELVPLSYKIFKDYPLLERTTFLSEPFKHITLDINGVTVVLAISGIGKVNASACTQFICDRYNPGYILNIGVAGSVVDDLVPGDVCLVDKSFQVDVDLTPLGYELGKVPNEPISISSDKDFLSKILEIYSKSNFDRDLVVVTAGSADFFLADEEKSKRLFNTFGIKIFDMETATISRVCWKNKVKFAAIRSISDSSKDKAAEEYQENLDLSKNYPAEIAYELIKKFDEVSGVETNE